MDTGELIEILQEAGLSPYQAQAYVTLLELGAAAASELATTSGVPGPRIYDILRDLEEDGYIVTYTQDQLYARALPPSEALDGIHTRVKRFQAAAEEIDDRWTQPETDKREITVVKRFDTVFEQTRQNIQQAEHHILLALIPPQYQALRPVLQDAYVRGVQIHIVLHPRPEEEITFQQTDFEDSCTEVRQTIPCQGKPFVALIDHQKVTLALNIDSTDEYGFIVDDSLHEYLLWVYLMCLLEAADVVYSDEELRLPIKFSEIRSFVRMVWPLLEEETKVYVSVTGRRLKTNYPCELLGEVIRVEHGGDSRMDATPSIVQLVNQVSFVLETDDETVSVGGSSAVIEDIEADEIVFEAVETQ